MRKHTPGPWRLEEHNGAPRNLMASKAKIIATYPCLFGKVDLANFRLLLAAPDLLAACKAAYRHITDIEGALGEHPDNPVPSMLRAAIAKAEGCAE